MIKRNYIYVILVLFLALNYSCSSFLDVVPDERPTEEDAFVDEFAAERFLYSCYNYLPAVRVGQSSIDLMTTDEVITSFEHETFAQFPKGTFTASNPVISYWGTLYKGIRQTYILVDNIDKVPGLSEDKKADYKAQANFLIGYYHFLLVRMYGPVILINGVEDVNQASDTYKARSTYEESVDFVVTKLDEAAASLPAKRVGNEYGLATSLAAKAIKARMLLYAASPLFNGGGGLKTSFYADFVDKSGNNLIPTNYDREKWKKAIDAYKEVIDLAEGQGYGLYANSTMTGLPAKQVEKDLRYTFVDKESNELIWTDTRREGIYDFQNKSTPFYSPGAYNGVSPTLSMVELFYTENGLPIDKDPAYNYSNRYGVGTSPLGGNTLNLNLHREPRFNAWIAYHNGNYEILRPGGIQEVKTMFRKNDDHGIKGRSNNYSPTGYLNKKGVSPKFGANQNIEAQPTIAESYPWPLVRLAELYLSYAEALIEYDASNITLAKTYIDKVRKRAGIPTIDEAWGPIGGATTQAQLRSIVRQERSIEFYLENHRFWDLRRWMEAEQPLGTQAKGMNIQGTTDAEFFNVTTVQFVRNFRTPAFYLMPIPTADINKNPNIVQNIGY
ncbi:MULTISPECIES: RagB/SusD family nutrient uptake outer membrane protein [Sphingobacterium]|uniref:RagB/SusD family nutrient uptake outer membrane protein n=1 Tax=Sphingobacterium litopenaei TaxID=2763500 RepID=A0ABR7YHJ9_9SPHI|nr:MULTISPECIES: RagB/SusD family nutrient uptake outer membrane protein [Sphingobacterium]MBD1430714.1 RagB/SusD family nutrient uptake outer membrane protein [Sphingobacterium litopenaei]NGM73994.1 RagB/SusD family nutrient uptake outer membrane protein [Sphingobacterium sp. SGL-16]